jgi:hypothetical protein
MSDKAHNPVRYRRRVAEIGDLSPYTCFGDNVSDTCSQPVWTSFSNCIQANKSTCLCEITRGPSNSESDMGNVDTETESIVIHNTNY